jgi:hypothetical protein
MYFLMLKYDRDSVPYSFFKGKGDSKIRECLALEGPPLLQMATERGMEAGPLQKLTNAVTEWTENAAKQAAADTEAAAQPPDERASIACNLFSDGSEAEPFDLAPATNPWAEHHDDARDRPFWFNATTGESLWEKPAAAQPAVPAAAAAAVESAQPAEATQATTSVSGGAE